MISILILVRRRDQRPAPVDRIAVEGSSVAGAGSRQISALRPPSNSNDQFHVKVNSIPVNSIQWYGRKDHLGVEMRSVGVDGDGG